MIWFKDEQSFWNYDLHGDRSGIIHQDGSTTDSNASGFQRTVPGVVELPALSPENVLGLRRALGFF